MENHFHTLANQREQFFNEANIAMELFWERPQVEKWSTGETLYHLYLMLRVFRRFSTGYIPLLKQAATLRRNKPFPITIHNIYKDYQHDKGRAMEAPFLIKPRMDIIGDYTVQELFLMLQKETDLIRMLVRKLDENIAGNIYYYDPIAYHPNLIQSIHLLAIHEQHHFDLVKKYYGDE